MPVIRIVSMTGKYGRRPRKAAYKMFSSPLGLHAVVLLVPADRRAFEDQTGPSHEGQCFWVAPRAAVTLSAKKTVAKRPRRRCGGPHFPDTDRATGRPWMWASGHNGR